MMHNNWSIERPAADKAVHPSQTITPNSLSPILAILSSHHVIEFLHADLNTARGERHLCGTLSLITCRARTTFVSLVLS